MVDRMKIVFKIREFKVGGVIHVLRNVIKSNLFVSKELSQENVSPCQRITSIHCFLKHRDIFVLQC